MPTALTDRVASGLQARFGDDVELVELQVVRSTLRVFIDVTDPATHPGGVDLELCAEAARALDDLADEWQLEVSSPGVERRLATPAHFRRFAGERVAVTLFAPLDELPGLGRTLTGRLAAADDDGVVLDDVDGRDPGAAPLRLTWAQIGKATLVYDWNRPKDTT